MALEPTCPHVDGTLASAAAPNEDGHGLHIKSQVAQTLEVRDVDGLNHGLVSDNREIVWQSDFDQSPKPEQDMLPEYRFDYSKARPNRFAAQLKAGSRAVVLDPDVAAVFSTPDSVNAVLRALIETMPQTSSK